MALSSHTSADGGDRFRDIVGNLPAALYTTDAEGVITYFNPAAAQLWGRSPAIGEDKWCGSWRLYWPDGTPLPHDQCPMAVTVKSGKPVRGAEAVCERPDGIRFPFTPFPTPIFDETGKLTGAVNMLIELSADVLARKPPSSHAPLERASQRDVAIASLFDQTARLVHQGDGFSANQWAIMRYLSLSARAREEALVAAYLGVPQAAVTRDLSILIRHRFVARVWAPTGELEGVTLSDEGRRTLQFDPLTRLAQAVAQLSEERTVAFGDSLEIIAGQLASDGASHK